MKTLLISLASSAVFCATATAQCGLDDQLSSGGCCAEVDLVLPSFPNFNLPSKGLRWDACGLAADECLSVSLSAPTDTFTCGVFDVIMRVDDCTGLELMQGQGTLTYTRTWLEERPQGTGTPPTELQVWRFLLQMQLEPVAPPALLAGLFPNSIQNCPDVYYYGHVDYALDCSTGLFENSLSMYHGSDRFSHGPLLSACPSNLDPISSYAIVGPHTNTAPFVPSDFLVAPAPVMSEALRKVESPVTGACFAEERFVQGAYNPIVFGCIEPLSTASIHQASIDFSGSGGCGTEFFSLNIASPLVPWRRLISTSIGRWSSNTTYPGPEALRADEGLFLHADGCNPAINTEYAIFNGVETLGGFNILPGPTPSFIASDHFVDLGTIWTAPTTGPLSFPALGFVSPTKFLIYANPQ